jgi:hypothetical protein
MIAAHRFGEYHTIWRVLAERATLEQAGWLLFSILESDVDYLHRYNGAAALLQMLDDKTWQPVELSADWGRARTLPQLKRLLEQRVGPPR